MAQTEQALKAENARLVEEIATMKKKVRAAFKKQQTELQAKLQAAEQRAQAAEAALMNRTENGDKGMEEDAALQLKKALQEEVESFRAQLEQERLSNQALQNQASEHKLRLKHELEDLRPFFPTGRASLDASASHHGATAGQTSPTSPKPSDPSPDKHT